ncbi:hypothetical protein RN001_002336 [Aquatica leii]|uniref:DDE Tnp4 domain-containing protein n=1 Tax=Aquatica leii TaxID=1421715 RepID=A0AAN7SST7_9COLE|nr:hypothetical protein RN001_002336 [Aquatica leii]
MERSTFSKVLAEITDAIVQYILPQWIRFPRTAIEMDRVKTGFIELGFPGAIGAIDCTHIAIVAPPLDNPIRPAVAYYNRKGYYSLNVHAICDANLQILNCNARFPGSTHDSAIWELSPVKEFLENKYLAGRLDSCWLIGDSGYPLQPFLLTPILNAEENSPEGRYNRSHIRARNCIERCFGVLKQRFRCLLKHRVLHYSPVRSANIVYTCATLHNMTINEGIDFEEAQHEANNINLGDNEGTVKTDSGNVD